MACALATALLLAWMLTYARYGLDFTDEGMYLNWISNPFQYDWSISQFGFVYHPLYLLLRGDIAHIRQANILIVFSLSWLLIALMMKNQCAGSFVDRIPRLTLSAGFATASLVVFSSWLVTPNYNTLAFQALLVTSIGIVLTANSPTPNSAVGGLLIGLGGWLAFMAKPSTALALACAVLVYLALSRKLSLRQLGIAASTALALLYVSSLIIDGSVASFVSRLQTSLTLAQQFDAGHTVDKILRIDSYQLRFNERLTIAVTSPLVFIAMFGLIIDRPGWKKLALLISSLFLLLTATIVAGIFPWPIGFGTFQAMVMWSLVLAAAALAVTTYGLRRFEYALRPPWPLALFFMTLPYVYAFGSNGNYWWVQGFAGAFWLIAGIVLLAPLTRYQRSWALAIPLVLATQTLSATLLLAGLNQPYRQPQALRMNDTVATLREERSALLLSAAYANYVESAQRAAASSGLWPSTPVLDLSGQSPGLLYALQALSVGQAWMIGGYPQSQKLAEAVLERVPCETLSQAWLLVEEAGPRRLRTDLVSSYGAQFDSHFTLAGTWQTAPGAGGYAASREQKLFKPVNPALVLARCRAIPDRAPSP